MSISNATIDSTSIRLESHGIPTFCLHLSQGALHQGFGNYDLRDYGADPLFQILKVVGVECWEDLPGKHMRIRRDKEGAGGIIRAIGHIVEDKWYEPEAA